MKTVISAVLRMIGATSLAEGRAGYVPKPAAGDQDKALFGDGTYRSVGTFYSTGAPSAGLGNNGNFYTDATDPLHPVVYLKVAGAWMEIIA